MNANEHRCTSCASDPGMSRMSGKIRHEMALFGIRNGAVWVAEAAFVTRQDNDILVEKWVGQRLVSIRVRATSLESPDAMWSALSEVAVETAWPHASSPDAAHRMT